MEKVSITIEFFIYVLVYVPKFSLNGQFWFFGPNLHKRMFLVEKGKNEHRHGILHIRNSNGTNFQFSNLQFWYLGTNVLKKGVSSQKQKK